jgi:hypothetical protein
MAFGIFDHPVTLTGEIAIQRVQGGPQLCRRRDGPWSTGFVRKMVQHRADAIDADLGIVCFAVPQPPVQPFDLFEITAVAATPAGSSVARPPAVCLRCCRQHADVEPIKNRYLADAGIGENAPQSGAAVGEGGQH